uniref:non-specific serine/threonine protein kinase n=1 Tax=Erpetoichthys calabaricus TaxID=27687 RepID=A0A8C4SMN2_ERPCA
MSNECHMGNPGDAGRIISLGWLGNVWEFPRKRWNLPICQKSFFLFALQENNLLKVPLEVGLMELASSGFECPGIIRLLESFIGTSTVLVVMELFEPCINLLDFINSQRRPLAENQAKGVFLQVVLAAHHCQKHGVFHGDIKPENLLIQVTTGQVKLSDFASGNIMHGEKYTSFTGTLIYAPPEWFLFQHFMAEHATVWSLGVTLYEMLCGYMPFMWVEAVVETQVTFTQELSVECQNLIKKCLAFNPLNRPTVKEILKHPWLYLKSSE